MTTTTRPAKRPELPDRSASLGRFRRLLRTLSTATADVRRGLRA
jgi:hypothetical protein